MKKNTVVSLALSCLLSPMFGTVCVAQDSKLDDMISPVSNPVNFEDPRSQTSLRPLYIYHKAPGDFVTGSGDVQVMALQLRVALTERLAFLATKDGYIQINADENLDDSEGFANVAGGFQYAIVKDDAEGLAVTTGLRYEAPVGESEVFQGNGDGVIAPHLSFAKAFESLNVIGYSGLRLGIDDGDSDFWDVSAHVDVPMGNVYPLVELNMVHVLDAGERIGLAAEGFDLVNFGSSASDGSTVVTAAVGARYRATEWLDFGAAYEFALTDREDIFDWRVTADLIVRLDWQLFS